MKLYGFMGSPYVTRTVLAGRVKGLDLPLTPPPGGDFKSPEYLLINPLGKMPALEDAGGHVIESMLIIEYLDDAYPQKPLLPANAMHRAQVRRFGKLCDTYLLPQFGALFRNMNPAARNAKDVDEAIKGIRKSVADLEHIASPTGPFLAGAEPSQADCAIAPCVNMGNIVLGMFGAAETVDGAPKLTRWWQQIQRDPIFGPALKEQGDAFRAFMSGTR